jgi:hypothetical protein
MTQTIKVLGQQNVAATTATTLYTVPAANSAVASSMTICNLTAAPAAYRVAVRPAGATLANVHYMVYDNTIQSFDTVFLTIGVSLATTDVVTVQSNIANVSFHLYGSEVY